jgi:kynurenine formamidase
MAKKMRNVGADGVTHYPGWSLETLKYLYETRKITASGHKPSDTDPGVQAFKDDYSLESYILEQNHWQIEFLANLDQVPEAGAIVLVSWPKVKAGSGFRLESLRSYLGNRSAIIGQEGNAPP